MSSPFMIKSIVAVSYTMVGNSENICNSEHIYNCRYKVRFILETLCLAFLALQLRIFYILQAYRREISENRHDQHKYSRDKDTKEEIICLVQLHQGQSMASIAA